MILETNDLIIRPSEWDDLEDFCRWEKLPEVTEFFSIRDGQTMEDVVRKFVADEEEPKAQQFTILLKEDGFQDAEDSVEAAEDSDVNLQYAGTRKIGRIVLADIEDGWKGEIWRIYIGDKTLRGKGYGKQAMEAMMGYCFDVLGLERLYLDHYTGNPAAGLYLSLGFKYEGVLRKNCRKNGVLYDVHLMSMLREEYEALFEE
ncbi:MAG: GNAT family N-acetyltransferase [Anaerovoracaceae bacterium]